MRAWMLLLIVVAACTPARRQVEGSIVRDIAVEGNGGPRSVDRTLDLRRQMSQKETRFGLLTWPFVYSVSPRALRHADLERDAYRLEVWYAHHGWLDARWRGWETQTVRPGSPRRAEVVDIVGRVEPGPRSTVRRLTIEGLDRVLAGIGNAVLRTAPIAEGDGFDLDLLELTRVALIEKLQNHARAFASVELQMDAHPEQGAVDVVLVVDPGPIAFFGDVQVLGNDNIRERFIRQNLTIESGQPFSIDAIRATQRRLFDMGTFAIVNVEPDLSDPQKTHVPIAVSVRESRFGTLRLGGGGGATYDTFLFETRASARVRHRNIANELLDAELGVRGGLAFDVAATQGIGRVPTWAFDGRVSYPRIDQQRGALELQAGIEQGVYASSFSFRRPQADLQFVYQFNDAIQVRAGPHFERYSFLIDTVGDGTDLQFEQRRLFGVVDTDGDIAYQLTSFDVFGTWDWRDDITRTTRGSYYRVWWRQAFRLSQEGFDFTRLTAEARRYIPIGRYAGFPFTLVGRVAGTWIEPWGASDAIPLTERAYLGGSTSLRGFRTGQVGFYDTLCVGSGREPTAVSRGGRRAAEMSAELRYGLTPELTLATFVDAGVLTDSVATLGANDLRASVGAGIRYDTLVGPLRFDVSVRPLYPEDDGPLSVDNCDGVPVADLRGDRNFLDLFYGANDRPDLAVVFFVTIGESI